MKNISKHYYEAHEIAYLKAEQQGFSSWDEAQKQSKTFETFAMKDFVIAALRKSKFESAKPSALEVGCGTGPLCCFLCNRGFRVDGVDISETAIRMAKKNAGKRGFEIHYRVADVCNDSLGTGRYDLIIDGHCLHCIVKDEERQRLLNHVKEALKPKGLFLIETMLASPPVSFGGKMILDDEGILWTKISRTIGFDLEQEFPNGRYLAIRRLRRNEAEIENELETAGFSVSWSEIQPPKKAGENPCYRAICRINA